MLAMVTFPKLYCQTIVFITSIMASTRFMTSKSGVILKIFSFRGGGGVSGCHMGNCSQEVESIFLVDKKILERERPRKMCVNILHNCDRYDFS